MLVKKSVSFVEHDIPKYKVGLEAQLVEIVRSRTSNANAFILNVYSSPVDGKEILTAYSAP